MNFDFPLPNRTKDSEAPKSSLIGGFAPIGGAAGKRASLDDFDLGDILELSSDSDMGEKKSRSSSKSSKKSKESNNEDVTPKETGPTLDSTRVHVTPKPLVHEDPAKRKLGNQPVSSVLDSLQNPFLESNIPKVSNRPSTDVSDLFPNSDVKSSITSNAADTNFGSSLLTEAHSRRGGRRSGNNETAVTNQENTQISFLGGMLSSSKPSAITNPVEEKATTSFGTDGFLEAAQNRKNSRREKANADIIVQSDDIMDILNFDTPKKVVTRDPILQNTDKISLLPKSKEVSETLDQSVNLPSFLTDNNALSGRRRGNISNTVQSQTGPGLFDGISKASIEKSKVAVPAPISLLKPTENVQPKVEQKSKPSILDILDKFPIKPISAAPLVKENIMKNDSKSSSIAELSDSEDDEMVPIEELKISKNVPAEKVDLDKKWQEEKALLEEKHTNEMNRLRQINLNLEEQLKSLEQSCQVKLDELEKQHKIEIESILASHRGAEKLDTLVGKVEANVLTMGDLQDKYQSCFENELKNRMESILSKESRLHAMEQDVIKSQNELELERKKIYDMVFTFEEKRADFEIKKEKIEQEMIKQESDMKDRMIELDKTIESKEFAIHQKKIAFEQSIHEWELERKRMVAEFNQERKEIAILKASLSSQQRKLQFKEEEFNQRIAQHDIQYQSELQVLKEERQDFLFKTGTFQKEWALLETEKEKLKGKQREIDISTTVFEREGQLLQDQISQLSKLKIPKGVIKEKETFDRQNEIDLFEKWKSVKKDIVEKTIPIAIQSNEGITKKQHKETDISRNSKRAWSEKNIYLALELDNQLNKHLLQRDKSWLNQKVYGQKVKIFIPPEMNKH